MIPAIFGAEGGGRPGKGQVVGKHSRTEDEPDGSRDAEPSACALPTRPNFRRPFNILSGEESEDRNIHFLASFEIYNVI